MPVTRRATTRGTFGIVTAVSPRDGLTGVSLELAVDGMSCDGCEPAVVSTLDEVDGVEAATADHETDHVRIEGDPDPNDAIDAVEAAGYEVDPA